MLRLTNETVQTKLTKRKNVNTILPLTEPKKVKLTSTSEDPSSPPTVELKHHKLSSEIDINWWYRFKSMVEQYYANYVRNNTAVTKEAFLLECRKMFPKRLEDKLQYLELQSINFITHYQRQQQKKLIENWFLYNEKPSGPIVDAEFLAEYRKSSAYDRKIFITLQNYCEFCTVDIETFLTYWTKAVKTQVGYRKHNKTIMDIFEINTARFKNLIYGTIFSTDKNCELNELLCSKLILRLLLNYLELFFLRCYQNIFITNFTKFTPKIFTTSKSTRSLIIKKNLVDYFFNISSSMEFPEHLIEKLKSNRSNEDKHKSPIPETISKKIISIVRVIVQLYPVPENIPNFKKPPIKFEADANKSMSTIIVSYIYSVMKAANQLMRADTQACKKLAGGCNFDSTNFVNLPVSSTAPHISPKYIIQAHDMLMNNLNKITINKFLSKWIPYDAVSSINSRLIKYHESNSDDEISSILFDLSTVLNLHLENRVYITPFSHQQNSLKQQTGVNNNTSLSIKKDKNKQVTNLKNGVHKKDRPCTSSSLNHKHKYDQQEFEIEIENQQKEFYDSNETNKPKDSELEKPVHNSNNIEETIILTDHTEEEIIQDVFSNKHRETTDNTIPLETDPPGDESFSTQQNLEHINDKIQTDDEMTVNKIMTSTNHLFEPTPFKSLNVEFSPKQPFSLEDGIFSFSPLVVNDEKQVGGNELDFFTLRTPINGEDIRYWLNEHQ